MDDLEISLFPLEIQEKIKTLYPSLSKEWKTALQYVLQDALEYIESWTKQAYEGNPNFKEEYKNFLFRKKNILVKQLEEEERQNDLSKIEKL